MIAELGEHILIDVDVTNAQATAASLENFVFSEDVQVRDATHELHRIQVHGPSAHKVVASALGVPIPPPSEQGGQGVGEPQFNLEPFRATTLRFNGTPVSIVRRDIAGTPGLHITIPREHAESLWQQLVAMDARSIGWYALNIARIEAGTPIFNIDFGPTNLPHETSLVDKRVSFKKGCYIGQEIVARMQNLGAPKQQLVGIAMQSDHLPVAGGAVFEIVEDKMGDRIGVITSSTISPMCSAQSIAFAMLRSTHAELATEVLIHAEGEEARGQVHPLVFWTSEGVEL
jgi:folate-binding protein YgfZ